LRTCAETATGHGRVAYDVWRCDGGCGAETTQAELWISVSRAIVALGEPGDTDFCSWRCLARYAARQVAEQVTEHGRLPDPEEVR